MGIIASEQVEVSWPQQQTVGLGGRFDVFKDDRDGVVDFASRVNPADIEAWPDDAGKVGDGLGPDGSGPDGIGHGGIGDGNGADGLGLDGFGALMMHHATPKLADGDWLLAVVGFDVAGNPAPAASGTSAAATVAGSPKPPGTPTASAWDNPGGTLTLGWTLSSDDEG